MAIAGGGGGEISMLIFVSRGRASTAPTAQIRPRDMVEVDPGRAVQALQGGGSIAVAAPIVGQVLQGLADLGIAPPVWFPQDR